MNHYDLVSFQMLWQFVYEPDLYKGAPTIYVKKFTDFQQMFVLEFRAFKGRQPLQRTYHFSCVNHTYCIHIM